MNPGRSLTTMNALRIARAVLIVAALAAGLGCAVHARAGASGKDGGTGETYVAAASSAKDAATAEPAAAPVPDTEHQTDETAGKGADLGKIAVSPKDGSPYLGTRNELVVVNVFSDFQCPVCIRSADPIKQLAIDFPGKVRVVFRHNPLAMHGRARAAARAAASAGRQGKFWEYHDRLFANQSGLDEASLRRVAKDLGLNLDKWERDRNDPQLDARITEEATSVAKLGAPGTPGIFVNGFRSIGWGSYQGLKRQVAREIAMGEQLLAQGTPRSEIPAARIRVTALENPKSGDEAPIDPNYWVQVLTAN